jgi:maspardin
VLLLPGIQGGGDAFFEIALELGKELPLIIVSAPNIEGVAEMTAATAAFVESLALPRLHLLGSSLGGYLVQALALARPQLAEQIVIANGFYDPAPFLAKQPPASAIAGTDASELAERNLRELHDGVDADVGEISLAAAMRALVGPVQTFENYKSRLLLMMDAPPLDKPSIEDERVMLIDNDNDPLILPEMRNALRRRFARAERHSIDDGGHLPAIQRPRRFADLLRRRFGVERLTTTTTEKEN